MRQVSLAFVPTAPYPGQTVPSDYHDRWTFMELAAEPARDALR